jgi:hypothetical protein
MLGCVHGTNIQGEVDRFQHKIILCEFANPTQCKSEINFAKNNNNQT